jgi:DNA-binding GntR family transcriptional regulator
LKSQDAARIEATSLVNRLVVRLREDIVSGARAPGSHIKIMYIADSHGVSMIPVREALARLLASRLVRVEANRGYFVASRPTPADYAELVKARELIETSALAAGFDSIDDTDIKALAALNDRKRKLAATSRDKRGILTKWAALNTAFHKVLEGSFRNQILIPSLLI